MIELMIIAVFLIILTIGGVVADYILPHVNPLVRYINGLPMMSGNQAHDKAVKDIRKEYAA